MHFPGSNSKTPSLSQLSDLHSSSVEPAQSSMRRRLSHLSTFESLTTTDQPEFSEWSDARLDRWLVDWALRNGKVETALSIAKHKNIEVGQLSLPPQAPYSCSPPSTL